MHRCMIGLRQHKLRTLSERAYASLRSLCDKELLCELLQTRSNYLLLILGLSPYQLTSLNVHSTLKCISQLIFTYSEPTTATKFT